MPYSPYFYPATAECAPNNIGSTFGIVCAAPLNGASGYGGGLDITTYDGTNAPKTKLGDPGSSILVDPVTATAPGYAGVESILYGLVDPIGGPWYVMKKVDFKDWKGLSGVFTRTTNFVMEVDIQIDALPDKGGFRDEAVNVASPVTGPPGKSSPYDPAVQQGCGIKIDALYTDPTTHLEVIVASKLFNSTTNGVDLRTPNSTPALSISFPRQVVSLVLPSITPAMMSTLVLRIREEQY